LAIRSHAGAEFDPPQGPQRCREYPLVILAGWWLALEHLVVGILLCITIIGIPLGVGAFKMAGAALVPFGKRVVRLSDLSQPAEGAIVVGS
jgi:uncharacterized membrane protein YccF (DUF307 family)